LEEPKLADLKRHVPFFDRRKLLAEQKSRTQRRSHGQAVEWRPTSSIPKVPTRSHDEHVILRSEVSQLAGVLFAISPVTDSELRAEGTDFESLGKVGVDGEWPITNHSGLRDGRPHVEKLWRRMHIPAAPAGQTASSLTSLDIPRRQMAQER